MRTALLALATVVLLPVVAAGQQDDAAYCARLADLATRYLGKRIDGASKPDVETLVAADRCQKGDTATGLRMLEKKLIDGGFTLPGR
ncbi:MAG: hypothetical protein KIT25_21260 [Enhydrobacter sp.]|nr:MAG: hypothetical protein KIT25_21260 [Enhydrobacter sp.]